MVSISLFRSEVMRLPYLNIALILDATMDLPQVPNELIAIPNSTRWSGQPPASTSAPLQDSKCAYSLLDHAAQKLHVLADSRVEIIVSFLDGLGLVETDAWERAGEQGDGDTGCKHAAGV